MWKLYLFIGLIFLPKHFEFSIGPLLLSPFRIFLIAFTPYVFYSIFIKRKFQWSTPDTLVTLSSVWVIIALSINTGVLKGIESGGILFLELFIPYFLARQVVSSYRSLKKVTIFLMISVAILVVPAIPETLTGNHYTHELFSELTGKNFYFDDNQRFGLWRAMSSFDHPIIFGSVCSVTFILSLIYIRRGLIYLVYALASVTGVAASVSSGALLGLVSQLALFSWARLIRNFPHKWLLLLVVIVFAYISVDILSNRDPFRVAFSYLLFSEHNGYVRYYVWGNSIYLVNQSIFSAIFGYGFALEQFNLLDSLFYSSLMKRSLDSYWLVNLMRYGWPMFLMLFLLIASVIRKNLYVSSSLKGNDRKKKLLIEAWLMVVFGFTLISFTVHFWTSMSSFYMILLAIACTNVKEKLKIS